MNRLFKTENIIMDGKINKSNESENVIMNENNEHESKSVTINEITGQSEIEAIKGISLRKIQKLLREMSYTERFYKLNN